MEGIPMTEQIKLLRNLVAIRMHEIDETTESGVIIARLDDKAQPEKGQVVAVGPKATECIVGSEVTFHAAYGKQQHKVNGEDLIIIPETDVLAIYEE